MAKLFSLGKVGRASALLAFFYLFSRVIGLWRDRILASHFGASDLLDVYYLSFNIPDFVFNLLIGGAISAAFIPVFIEYQSKNEREAWKLASNFLNTFVLVVIALSGLLAIFAPQLIGVIAPGFLGPKKDLTILFTRVMLLSPLIMGVSLVVGSLLQVFHRFLAFAAAPIMYNLGIIVGAIWFVPKFGPLGLAEGVVLGALLHLLVQWPFAWKMGFRWQMVLDWGEKGLRKVVRLTIPRAIGLAAIQVYTIIAGALATMLSSGTVTVFNLANNLQFLPIALVGISVAVASFPTLSREALQEEKKDFVERVEKHIRQVIFITVPLSFLCFFLRHEIVRIILYAGNFSLSDAALTAKILGFFMLGVASQSLVPVLSRAFYALQNTITPVLISLLTIGVNIALAFYFIKIEHRDASGLALAFSLAGILNAVLLLIFFKKHLKIFHLAALVNYISRAFLATVLMFLILSFLTNRNFLIATDLLSDIWRVLAYSLIAALTFLGFSATLDTSFFGGRNVR